MCNNLENVSNIKQKFYLTKNVLKIQKKINKHIIALGVKVLSLDCQQVV